MTLYKVIYPIYRIEASDPKEAQAKAEQMVKLGGIRVVPDEASRPLIKRLITGK